MARGFDVWCELTVRCNLSCSFCYNHWREHETSAPGDVSATALADVFRQLVATSEIETVTISGGEPLRVPGLWPVLDILHHANTRVVIATNGTLLDEGVVRRLLEHGVSTVQVSILSADPRVHDELAGREAWAAAVSGLAAARLGGLHTAIVFVATRANVQCFPDVVELGAVLGVRTVIFNEFVPGSGAGKRNRSSLAVSRGDLVNALQAARASAERYGVSIVLGTPFTVSDADRPRLPKISGGVCPVGPGQRRFVLDRYGNVRLCPQSDHSLGNIFSRSPEELLGDHWGSACASATAPAERCPCLA